ncbi:uncharacterized protein LOC107625364 isoform X2 [Arachis ipaensis]|uniref:uncharacterized protein LOC107613269 isoform X2 n=1 Tax=Arachis ipaensis TaxID=130454 RepID=UPI0007AF7A24|nr:uncharacterized protein LOC107613269 isoform X2 [Arachis ipaensis]XP_016183475.1 uncharacterized protein LOC107625364 isoform X2 [Arachis ipaensis]XP_025633011.1 uncharacterized protein LOC112727478 isoform X2 [Arachis hypogaea]
MQLTLAVIPPIEILLQTLHPQPVSLSSVSSHDARRSPPTATSQPLTTTSHSLSPSSPLVEVMVTLTAAGSASSRRSLFASEPLRVGASPCLRRSSRLRQSSRVNLQSSLFFVGLHVFSVSYTIAVLQ